MQHRRVWPGPVVLACLFAFWAGYAAAGCFVCSQTVRFDCTNLGLKLLDGQCILGGTTIHWKCDFRGAKKKYWCRFQLRSNCPVTSDCDGVCEHTFGTVACHEGGHPGC